ncbi:MAG: hypothetical protein DYG89_05955 [Caldilinea sp. CFX5]|nr:hypothetical protein [Caldilinea sp. CFX5]
MYNPPTSFGPLEALLCLVLLGFIVLTAIVYWRIFAKTGHPGVLGLLMLIPVINFIMLLFLAFSEWPLEREYNRLAETPLRKQTRY